MKRKLLSLLLLLSLTCSLCAAPTSAADSSAAVQSAQALGILSSSSALTAQVTRAQFAQMLTAASSYKDSISQEGSGYSLFKDVKSGHWASEYIRLAVEQGWMTGYTDGSFRPDQTVKLEEACTAVLKLLGYSSTDLAGSFPSAQLSKASALGLRSQITLKQGGVMTNRDCANLFYNLMGAKTANGQSYGSTLGYTVTNGEVDFTSVLLDSLQGPYVASGGDTLTFQPATIYRNGKASTSAALNQYDVYYYNQGTSTLWVYTDRVSGKVNSLSPSSTNPSAVTLSGSTYAIGSAYAAYQLSVLGGGGTDQLVTLLLGMDDEVVGVLTGSSVDMVYCGVVESCSRSVTTEGAAAVQTDLTVICADGVARTFSVEGSRTFSAGSLVSVSVTKDGITVSQLSEKHTSGKVDSSASKLGSLTFAADVQVLDAGDDGAAVAVDVSTLAGMTLGSSDVRYYSLDSQGCIDVLILDDVTGQLWTYAYLTDVTDQSQNMNISVSYTYLENGTQRTLRASSVKYPVSAGGIAVSYLSDGSVKSMKSLSSVKLTQLSTTWAMANNRKLTLDDSVQVYLRQSGSYYLTTLSAVNTEDYTLTGWYTAGDNQVRLIVAAAK